VSRYRLVRRTSTAAEFHALAIPEPAVAEVWLHEVTTPALVLGSTQRDDVVDRAACARAGVDVVRRRSGGGAVLLLPGEVVWVDVILPAGAPGWSDDVHRPMVWLGEHLRAAFAASGVVGVGVHTGAMISTAASRLVCFDGLGPGEVSVGGAKLVGISQRRTRAAARLQVCWYSHYDPAVLPRLLRADLDVARLRPVATVERATAVGVAERLVDHLDAAT
jgi:lipoate-protein ligase A